MSGRRIPSGRRDLRDRSVAGLGKDGRTVWTGRTTFPVINLFLYSLSGRCEDTAVTLSIFLFTKQRWGEEGRGERERNGS